jgi:hypothetical protein
MIQIALLFFVLLLKTSGPVATIPNWLNCLPDYSGWCFDVGATSCTAVLLGTWFHAGFLFGLFFDPEDWDDMFLRNVGWLSTDYMAVYPRRSSSSSSIINVSGKFCVNGSTDMTEELEKINQKRTNKQKRIFQNSLMKQEWRRECIKGGEIKQGTGRLRVRNVLSSRKVPKPLFLIFRYTFHINYETLHRDLFP